MGDVIIFGMLKKHGYALATIPFVVSLFVSLFVTLADDRTRRRNNAAEHALHAAEFIDLRLGKLLELTSYCATSPALTEAVISFETVAENCGRYARLIDAWVVIVELGDVHRQILNTRADAPEALPVYPREEEYPTLLALEKRSKASGLPGIAEVFAGKVLDGGVLTAGQYVKMGDGRQAMVYVGMSALVLSKQLAEFITSSQLILGLIDPSNRIVARSRDIESYLFTDAPGWILPMLEAGQPGSELAGRGPSTFQGRGDIGYHPLSTSKGWMAVSVNMLPSPALSIHSVFLPFVFVISGLATSLSLWWFLKYRDNADLVLERLKSEQAISEQRAKEKSMLLAAFAHDVRTPLISLIGSLTLLDAEADQENSQLNSALASAEALLQFMDDVLELSFVGSGKLILQNSSVDLSQMLKEVIRPLQQKADEKGLKLQVDIGGDVPSLVSVDRLRLQQVMSNLVSNAIKYTLHGSVRVGIMVEKPDDTCPILRFFVTDTGVGFSPEDEKKIFSEFGRLDRDIEQREAGSGLGLPICRKILKQMGVEISWESEVGKGSTFSFHLPAPITDESISETLETMSLKDLVILYAEDEPIIRKLTVQRLTEAGAKVIEAENGRDVIATLEDIVPDLVLLDLLMPVMNGIETIRALRRDRPDLSCPVCVLTSHISGLMAFESWAAGADDVLTKPLQVNALVAVLQNPRGNKVCLEQPNCTVHFDPNVALLEEDNFRMIALTEDQKTADLLLIDFESTLRADITAMIADNLAGRFTLIADKAHKNFGLCRIMGATRLGERLFALEEAVCAEAPHTVEALLSGLEDELEATLAKMRNILNQNTSTDHKRVS